MNYTKHKNLYEFKVKRIEKQIAFIKTELNSWVVKDKDQRALLKSTLECLESELEDVKALAIIVEKGVELGDIYGYETYQDYRINYYEEEMDANNGEGYPYWWLEEEQFNLLKKVFSRNYGN